MTREVVVVSAVRTAIGTFGGSLKDVPPTELGALVVKESLARASVEGKDVGHVVFGHVVNTEPKDMYLSRVAAINGGCAEGTPAFNVNRLCGSGLQAIVSAAQAIQLGDADVTIGAGAEVMSRASFASDASRVRVAKYAVGTTAPIRTHPAAIATFDHPPSPRGASAIPDADELEYICGFAAICDGVPHSRVAAIASNSILASPIWLSSRPSQRIRWSARTGMAPTGVTTSASLFVSRIRSPR